MKGQRLTAMWGKKRAFAWILMMVSVMGQMGCGVSGEPAGGPGGSEGVEGSVVKQEEVLASDAQRQESFLADVQGEPDAQMGMPERVLDGMPEWMPGRALDGMPEWMPEGMLDGMPDWQGNFRRAGVDGQKGMEGTVTGRKTVSGSLEIVPAEFAAMRQGWGDSVDISIGSLLFAGFPLGWEMEQRVSEDGAAQYVLIDVHSECGSEGIEKHRRGYGHEIVITPYEIRQMPELPLQLAAQMREYFQVPLLRGVAGVGKTEEIKGCWMFGENPDLQECEYILFSWNGNGGMELFHVRESSIRGYENEVETFWDFLDKRIVRTEGGEYVAEWYASGRRPTEHYFWFNEDGGEPLFLVVQEETGENGREAAVYRKGSYGEAAVKFQADRLVPERIGIVDINQDGYEDFLCKRLLLNPLYSLDYVEKDDFEGYLWDEGNGTFVYVDGEQMFKKYGGIWAGRMDRGDDWRGKEMVPGELADYVARYLLKDREEMREAILALVSDRELTMEEVEGLAEGNIAIKNEMLSIASTFDGWGIWLWIDADNDGMEDIFLCEYLGGSAGFVDYYLFTGTGDGQYELTDRTVGVKEEFRFICWEGKNYLVRTTWEYAKKVIDGVALEYFEDGVYQGGVWLAIAEKEGEDARSIQVSYLEDEQYRSLGDRLLEFAGGYISGDRVQPGTAEEENEEVGYGRRCDIDNDGEAEEYHVSLWQTTNYYTVDQLSFDAKEEGVKEQFFLMANADSAVAGVLRNLWVDETEYGNVTYALYEEGLYDFHICGYLLSETDSRKLVQVDCGVGTEVALHGLAKSGRHGGP